MLSLDSILTVDVDEIPKAIIPRGCSYGESFESSLLEEDYNDDFAGREIPCPSAECIESFRDSHSDLSSSSALISSGNPKSLYDLNWINIDDYINNWHILDRENQLSLRRLILADNKTNRNRFGLKRKNLESHLLLAVGCDLSSIISGKHDAVQTNLKSPDGFYSSRCCESRALDPKTCLRAYNKFKKEYNLAYLFEEGYQAYQCVISPTKAFKVSENIYESRERFKSFFKTSLEYLSNLAHKKNKISSYLYSNEVSVDSILKGEYRPHTHLIIFLPKENKHTQQERVQDIEREFNSRFSDRKMCFVSDEDSGLPVRVSRLEKIENSVGYLFRSYSLQETYSREISINNIRELNRKTKETYHTLKEILNNSALEKGVRRFNSSNIPRKGKEHLFKHRVLQKIGVSTRIKKEKTTQKREMVKISKPSTSVPQANAPAQKPASQGTLLSEVSSKLPKAFTEAPAPPKGFPAPTKPLPGDSRFVGPLLPYQQDPSYQAYEGMRANASELNRAGIGLEDFMGGGGRFSIYENLNPPSVPVEAGTNTLRKKSSFSILEGIRQELYKSAHELGDSFPYSPSSIKKITESPISFMDALHKEASMVWEGISEVLRKEAGCDADFLMGILKEAGENLEKIANLNMLQAGPAANPLTQKIEPFSEEVGKMQMGTAATKPAGNLNLAGDSDTQLGIDTVAKNPSALNIPADRGVRLDMKGSIAPAPKPLTATSLSPDRHRILKFLPNKLTGLGGGALLGTMLSNQLGLSGPFRWLPIILGAMAGHHYLPKLMNHLKDPMGEGVNAISPVSASISQANAYKGPQD